MVYSDRNMLRRTFLKLSGIIPFLGTLFAGGRVGASEEQHKEDKSNYNYVRQCPLCHHLCFTKNPEGPICPHCQKRSGAMYVYYPYAYFYCIDNDGELHVEYCER